MIGSSSYTSVLVVGGSGRIGRAMMEDMRKSGLRVDSVSVREGSPRLLPVGTWNLVVNAAGVAHVSRAERNDDLASRLYKGNLRAAEIACEIALQEQADFVHLSSVKAQLGRWPNLYSASKRFGEEALLDRYEEAFAKAQRSLQIVRIPAMLAPPYDAGKLGLLRGIWWTVPRSSRKAPAMKVADLTSMLLAEGRRASGVLDVAEGQMASWYDVRQALKLDCRVR